MDLVYTTYRHQNTLKKSPDWLQEGHSLSAVSSRNTVLFTTSTLLTGGESPLACWGCHLYCADLNIPWEPSLVSSSDSAITSLAWDDDGTRFVSADLSGVVSLWEMEDSSISDWRLVATSRYNHERFIAARFFSKSRPISLNAELKDSLLYTEKFSSDQPSWSRSTLEGCVLVSGTGLLVTVAFTTDQEPVFKAASVGIGRRRIVFADVATTREGQLIVATSGSEAPVVVYTVVAGFDAAGELSVRVNSHSSFSLKNEDKCRVSGLKFLLGDSTESLVLGVGGPEGGRVQVWDLAYKPRTVHKLFSSAAAAPPRAKNVPEWVFGDEFCSGGAQVTALSSPSFSLLGGARPGCYIAVGLSDGSVQLLLRDNLAQIASVELPRGGNLAWAKSSAASSATYRVTVTICSLAFTATGNCLLATDSLGQLYLYRLSPISDPGGPTLAPYIVTILEYCLVSGRDWWDLAIAADPTKLEAIGEMLSGNFSRQPPGQQQYFYSRFMALRSSVFRLTGSSQYKAADTNALLMLKSINGAFKGLLRAAESNYLDYTDPCEKLEMTLASQDDPDIETAIQQLTKAGLAREHQQQQDSATVSFLHQLSVWVTTLSLHLLAAVPEFKSRKGPGYNLLHDGQSLAALRELLAMARLWNMSRVNIICTEKEMDLTARLFSMVTRLGKKPDDEALQDECLMLPHKVMIPPLDTVHSSRGVLSSLHNIRGSPLSFTFGTEPDLPINRPAPFIEGLSYTDDQNADYYYDSVQKLYLGRK